MADPDSLVEVWLAARGAVSKPMTRQMKGKRRKWEACLLVDFFRKEYYEAYDSVIRRLISEDLLLLTPQQNPRLIERLDFRPDLPRGAKKIIYSEIARLLQSGSSVLRPRYAKNDFFRWLASPQHSNLGEKFQTIERAVNQLTTDDF